MTSSISDKETYRELCETEGDRIPLFQQYWWMETVCTGKHWDVAFARAKDGTVTGALPYLMGSKFGLRYILQPQLTQYSGPLFFYDAAALQCEGGKTSESNRLDFEKRVADTLIRQMETLRPSAVIIHSSPRITNWLPFYWHGYSQTTRYTYRIPQIGDSEAVFAAFDRKERQRKILKMLKKTSIRFDMRPEDFAALHHRYWASKGQRDLLQEEFIIRVCTAAIARGQGVIGSLHDNEGQLLAARFVAYDSHSAYTLLSAYVPELHRSGHSETLMWLMIQHLGKYTQAFDFEGSMDEGIEYFYRSFGTVQTPFFELTKFRNRTLELLLNRRRQI